MGRRRGEAGPGGPEERPEAGDRRGPDERPAPQVSEALSRRRLLALAVAAEGGLLALAFLLGAVLGIGPLQALRIDWSGAWGAAAGLGATGVAVGGWRYGSTWPPVRRFRDLVEELVQRAFGNAGLADLVIVSALAAIAEEALFRGVAQVAIARALDPWSAAAAAGLLFGVAHWVSFLYALYATLLGVVLGALFVAFDNLLAPVAAHFTYDVAALAYLVRMQGRD